MERLIHNGRFVMKIIFQICACLVFGLMSASALRAAEKPASFELLFEDKLDQTEGIAVCPDGSMYVSENASGNLYHIVDDATLESEAEGLERPAGMACDAQNRLYVNQYAAGSINRYTFVEGGYDMTTIAVGLTTPNGIIVRSDGMVFVSESDTGTVKIIDPDLFDAVFIDGVQYANGLAFNEDETVLYINSTTGNKTIMTPVDGPNKGKKKTFASGVRMADGLVRDGKVFYVCLYAEGKIARVDAEGKVTIIAEGLKSPASPAVRDGALYVTNLGGKGIYKIPLPEQGKE